MPGSGSASSASTASGQTTIAALDRAMPFVRHELGGRLATPADPGPARPARRHRSSAGRGSSTCSRRSRPAGAATTTAAPDDETLPTPVVRLRHEGDLADEPPPAAEPPPPGRVVVRAVDQAAGDRRAPAGPPSRGQAPRATGAAAARPSRSDDLGRPRGRGRRPCPTPWSRPSAGGPGRARGQPREPGRRHARRGARGRDHRRGRGGRATPSAPTRSRRCTTSCPAIERFRTDPEPGASYDLLVVVDCGSLDRVGAIRHRHARAVRRPAPGRRSTTTCRTRASRRPTGSTRTRPRPARWSALLASPARRPADDRRRRSRDRRSWPASSWTRRRSPIRTRRRGPWPSRPPSSRRAHR